ncbi:MAG: phenylacetate--CoA ligase family protein [Chloroflexi bacterium]|nr:phenylacetate--CoA ligase family protein [Chloroflexota bacterium]
MLLGVLRARSRLRAHDRWSRAALIAAQARSLRAARDYATARSPFYREIHRGLEDAPLSELPVVTKQQLMERFDDVVTDRAVRLADVEAHLAHAAATDVFRGRYRVAATGGTTGRRGVFLANESEWQSVLASYSRAYDWAGLRAGLTNRLRMAVVSSRDPAHQSAIVGATVASRFVPTLRLDATQPIGEIVRELNTFRPDALVGYASLLGVLAEERLEGRLTILPKGIFGASEVLTDDVRARLRAAFGVEPTNVYAATETAGIASECRQGRLHAYEDLVIAEIVDQRNQPVGPGGYGAKLLVTVLLARTQPLIRYELSDRVQRLDGACPDGLPFGLIGGIEGREEEVLTLAGARVHPNVFHSALQAVRVSGWQVIEEKGTLRVLLARPLGPIVASDVATRITSQLELAGAHGVPIEVAVVPEIPRTRLGKAPLIRRSSEHQGEQSR